MTLRVCLLGLLKGRRGNIQAGSKTFRLRINRFKNFPLRNTILLSQRTRGKGRDFFLQICIGITSSNSRSVILKLILSRKYSFECIILAFATR